MYLLLRRMLDAYKEQHFTNLSHARAMLFVELLRQETEGASALPEKQQRALSALAEEISLHPEAKWNTTQMSRKLHMSRATLTRMFQTEYDLPPKTFVIRQRIARAIELLTSTNHTIEAITQMVGYESVASFSNSFRQQTGKRPGQFRAAHAGRSGG
jgi:transcriptional regulator GlxA family with amidase domain